MKNLTEEEMSRINGGEVHWIALISGDCLKCYFSIAAAGWNLYTLITSFGGKAVGKKLLKKALKEWIDAHWVDSLFEIGSIALLKDSCGNCVDAFCGE